MGKVFEFPKNPELAKLSKKRMFGTCPIAPENIASSIKKELDDLQALFDEPIYRAEDLTKDIHDIPGGNGP